MSQTLKIILFCIIAVGQIPFHVNYDYDEIKRGVYPNHAKETFFIGLMIVGLALTGFGWHKLTLVLCLGWLPVEYLLFNGGLNLKRKEPLSYIGEFKPTSSIGDRFWHLLNKDRLQMTSPYIVPFQIVFLIITAVADYLILR